MSSIKLPNSDIELQEGSVVMLNRFPGTKWVVHEGWYNYNGKRYSGWYFSSIPANTTLPASEQDLAALVVVSGKSEDTAPETPEPPIWPYPPVPPVPPHPPIPPHPPTPPGPGPEPPYPPFPPFPPYPPFPPKPEPEPEEPAFFSVKLKAQLDEAFITVPTLRQRDAFITDELPNGKIVRVNSVNGEPKYYIWDKVDDEWKDLNFVFSEDLEDILDNYYTEDDVDELLQAIHDDITAVQNDLDSAVLDINSTIASLDEKVDTIDLKYEQELSNVQNQVDRLDNSIQIIDGDITTINDKVDALEAAVNDIQKLVTITSENTVLVSDHGGIKDSNYSLGDDIIGESSEYADATTLATEKAVALKVEDATPKWTSF